MENVASYPLIIQTWLPNQGATYFCGKYHDEDALIWAQQKVIEWNDLKTPETLLKAQRENYTLWGTMVQCDGKGYEDFGRDFTEIRAILVDSKAVLPKPQELQKQLLEYEINHSNPLDYVLVFPMQERRVNLKQEKTPRKRSNKVFMFVLLGVALVIIGYFYCFRDLNTTTNNILKPPGNHPQNLAGENKKQEKKPMFLRKLKKVHDIDKLFKEIELWKKQSLNINKEELEQLANYYNAGKILEKEMYNEIENFKFLDELELVREKISQKIKSCKFNLDYCKTVQDPTENTEKELEKAVTDGNIVFVKFKELLPENFESSLNYAKDKLKDWQNKQWQNNILPQEKEFIFPKDSKLFAECQKKWQEKRDSLENYTVVLTWKFAFRDNEDKIISLEAAKDTMKKTEKYIDFEKCFEKDGGYFKIGKDEKKTPPQSNFKYHKEDEYIFIQGNVDFNEALVENSLCQLTITWEEKRTLCKYISILKWLWKDDKWSVIYKYSGQPKNSQGIDLNKEVDLNSTEKKHNLRIQLRSLSYSFDETKWKELLDSITTK